MTPFHTKNDIRILPPPTTAGSMCLIQAAVTGQHTVNCSTTGLLRFGRQEAKHPNRMYEA